MDLSDLRNREIGRKALVIGLGGSAKLIKDVPDSVLGEVVTIGVNDVSRLIDPKYLVICDPPSRFTPDRRKWIIGSQAIKLIHSPRVKRWRDENADDTGEVVSAPMVPTFQHFLDEGSAWLPSHATSPYPALGLAAYLGCNPIGLIGVDFTGPRFYEEGSRPRQSFPRSNEELNGAFTEFAVELRNHGVLVFNLSNNSVVVGIPQARLDYFAVGL